MILYVDTGSLVKLYIEETHSDLVREWAAEAEAVATCRVAYPEALSAFARRWSRGDLSDEKLGVTREALDADWASFLLLPLRERRAGSLAIEHLLRGFDAVHLAAALELLDEFESDDLVFSSFDTALLKSAQAAGLSTLHPG